jgi:2-polyprenyl-3-methyl-5-hydroxy-6-metoxy-1,4-benzoquinol methylase
MQPLRMRLLREAIDKHMPGRDVTSLRVLDVGCGGGLMSEAMAELGAHVTAVDPSLNNIEAARKHLPIELAGRVNYQQATAGKLPPSLLLSISFYFTV